VDIRNGFSEYMLSALDDFKLHVEMGLKLETLIRVSE